MALPEGSYTQTCFVVRNIEDSATRWTRATGAGPWYVFQPDTRNTIYRDEPGNDKYRLALGFLGGTCMELVQPLDREPSIFNEILEARGEGFHHVCPQMSGLSGASFDARCRELEQRGLKLAMSNEVVGLGRASFYDALDSIGGFIEVFELGKGYPMVPVMADGHLTWNGANPLRPLETLFGGS
ncbi:MAG: VOC family protein [Phycisphaerales bacterium]|nr:VOC family protein [Hyphomonadaceae bacterium]